MRVRIFVVVVDLFSNKKRYRRQLRGVDSNTMCDESSFNCCSGDCITLSCLVTKLPTHN